MPRISAMVRKAPPPLTEPCPYCCARAGVTLGDFNTIRCRKCGARIATASDGQIAGLIEAQSLAEDFGGVLIVVVDDKVY